MQPAVEDPGDDPRGRRAERPREIGRRGRREIARRVTAEIAADHVGLMAAGVAFYAMLALFPALIACITLYGLFTDPAELAAQIAALARLLPPQVRDLLGQQLAGVVSGSPSALGWGAVAALAGALWSASKGMQGLIEAVGVAYDEPDGRPGWKVRGLALLSTLAAVVGVVVALALIALVPALIDRLGLGAGARWAVRWLRWPLLAALAMAGLVVIYRRGPDRTPPKWRWVSWGSALATVLWLAASGLFSLYVRHFGSFGATYGSLGAVIVLLLWLNLSAFVVLLGAEVNAEMELQTVRDTTRGAPRPLGRRGAAAADRRPEDDG